MSSESPDESTHQPILSQLVHSIFSSADDNNVMMAAIISLVVVILFVFTLHLYARSSFHSRSLRHRRRRNRRLSAVTPPSSLVLDLPPLSCSVTKGLDPSVISAIPLFVYEAAPADEEEEAECVICLSDFDGGEVYRRLPKCGHEFHVECVDMWLGSHSNCPICRALVVATVPDCSSVSYAEANSQSSNFVSSVDNGDGSVDFVATTGDIDNNNYNNSESSSSGAYDCSTSSFGYSLKRMLSRNRSERKVSPAATNMVCSSSNSTNQFSRE